MWKWQSVAKGGAASFGLSVPVEKGTAPAACAWARAGAASRAPAAPSSARRGVVKSVMGLPPAGISGTRRRRLGRDPRKEKGAAPADRALP